MGREKMRDKTGRLDNIISVDGHDTHILDHTGVLPSHYIRQYRKQYARSIGHFDITGIRITYKKTKMELYRWCPKEN